MEIPWLFPEMWGHSCAAAFRVFTVASVIVLGQVATVTAMEVQFGANTMATFSDNIDRDPVGLEKKGHLYTMQGDLIISGDLGSGSLDLTIGGGWESLDNGESSDIENDAFRFQLDINLPWSETGTLELSAGSADKTVEPEITDISQSRVRTRTTDLRFGAENNPTPTFGWTAGLTARKEERFDRDLDETGFDLGWETELNARRTVTIDIGIKTGTEDIQGDSWDGSTLSIGTARQVSRLVSTGYRLEWNGSQFEDSVGSREVSNRISAVYHYEKQMSSNWSFMGDIGVDGIHTESVSREWLPRLLLDLNGEPGKRTRFTSSISVYSSIQDPVEAQVTRTTDSLLDTGLTWDLSRTFSITPRVRFRHARLFGEGSSDRTDRTLISQLGTKWEPARNWSFEVTVLVEERNSSLDSFDLTENRFDLGLTGKFF